MKPELRSYDDFVEEAAFSSSMTLSPTVGTSPRPQSGLSLGYFQLLPEEQMREAILNNPYALDPSPGIDILSINSSQQNCEMVDEALMDELGQFLGSQLAPDLLSKVIPGHGGSFEGPDHYNEPVSSAPSAICFNHGADDGVVPGVEQCFTDDLCGLQEDWPINYSSNPFLAPGLHEKSYFTFFNAPRQLDLEALLREVDASLNVWWCNALQETKLEPPPDYGPVAPGDDGQQCCESSDKHSSDTTDEETSEIGQAESKASWRRTGPSAPSGRLQQARKRNRMPTLNQTRSRSRISKSNVSRRSSSPPLKGGKSVYIRLEEIIGEEGGSRYTWNRRVGLNGSWMDMRKNTVETVHFVGALKQLKMTVRPDGGGLVVHLRLSDTSTYFEGEVQGGGRLRVRAAVIIEMCENPQRCERFEATFYSD
ncbi:hypothetical protein J7T55_000114 [Diaporthe amygdali]|uniref:uncharacterized protein n=1 Tax=Phomopsis amygdali TaxID=1214568 RepID=UPI0022FE07A4|nr:uncharacterized protein J7T55_000114 [Diaporthe amygdali]KAJ0100755.1 hypothetical protein J7T55_000114 [Diaporthe amygdali]